ncbi:MAG: SDR family NAD(P)-dependent oxidoreductase, partial [Flavobacteriales bacterium]
KIKITYLPLWLRDFILFILRTFTGVKTYGPYEFLLSVLTMDMVGEKRGEYELERHFFELNV